MTVSRQPILLRRSALGLAILAALLMGWRIQHHLGRTRRIQAEILDHGRREAGRAAKEINEALARLMPVAEGLASEISAGRIKDGAISGRIREALEANPLAFQIGVVFAPEFRPDRRLFAPFVSRGEKGIEAYELGTKYDYTTTDFYKDGMAKAGWGDPHLSKATGAIIVGYSVSLHRAGERSGPPIGMVRLNISMEGIRKIVASVSMGQTGYGFLLSNKGVYLADPVGDYVRRQRTIFDIAKERQDPARQQLGELALRGERGHVEGVSSVTQQPILIFSEPIPVSRWSLGAVFIKDELSVTEAQDVRRDLIQIGCAAMALLAALAFLLLRVQNGGLERIWQFVAVTTVVLGMGISWLWFLTLHFNEPSASASIHIVDQAGLNGFLAREGHLHTRFKSVEALQVPTGIFVQALRFGSQGEAVVTGYLWQKLSPDLPKDFRPGVVFPDAESSEVKEAFRRKEGLNEVVVFNFKASLRHRGDQAFRYPFDRTSVSLQMWPKDFAQNQILVPDLGSYQLMNPTTRPGVESSLNVAGWSINQAFFSYSLEKYNTNFGIDDFAGQEKRPELAFNMGLQRKFLDPFISTVLPLLVIACLLFTLLLVTTKIKDKVAATGFKATDILRAAATLLFPVIYAQISLRSRIAASGLIYMEYFYFVMYTVILLVAVNTLSFTIGGSRFTEYGDNAIPKFIYWPVLLGSFFAISLGFLY